jgi:hypothetical protein
MYTGDGVCHRRAVLRPLSGHQEQQLASGAPSPEDVNDLLSESLVRVGSLTELTPRRVSAMTCGDRDHLLLTLRAASLGRSIHLALQCSNPTCAVCTTLVLDTDELCETLASTAPNSFMVDTSAGRALIREPTGEDELALAALPPGERADQFWVRVLIRIGDRGRLSVRDWRSLSRSVRQRIAVEFDQSRRGPRLSGGHPCPGCEAVIPWAVSAGTLLSTELRPGAERIPEEVHAFAWHYGWSEAETLALPRQRRWTYLRRLRQAVEADG